MLLPFASFTPSRVWRLPEYTPASIVQEAKALPVGALPARLLRSGEYTIRGVCDLNAVGWLCRLDVIMRAW
ncbi:MAG TPA: hypothetical protein VFE38_02480 [Edaphobacter sp.]|nr:hypothetical protein [Edaphobacter sp.]